METFNFMKFASITNTTSPGRNLFPQPGSQGQVKLSVRQVDFSKVFFKIVWNVLKNANLTFLDTLLTVVDTKIFINSSE